MLPTIIDTLNIMPGWAQFLVYWPLPSLLCLLIMRFIYKEELNSRFLSYRETAKGIIIFFSIIWPLCVIVLLIAAVLETGYAISRFWKQFDDWATSEYKHYQKARKQKIGVCKNGHFHYYKNERTSCGVGNPMNVRTTNDAKYVTCPTCLFIMRRADNEPKTKS